MGQRSNPAIAWDDGAQRDGASRYAARVVFYEAPPGTQGLAALLALVGLLIAGLFMMNLTALATNGSVISGVPALFLAIPATFSALSFPSSSANRIQQAPLRARIGLFLVAAASLSGALSLVILNAHGYTSLSLVTWAFWGGLVSIFAATAAWNLSGLRFNQRCLQEALDLAGQRADSYTEDDYLELKKRDKERGRDGHD